MKDLCACILHKCLNLPLAQISECMDYLKSLLSNKRYFASIMNIKIQEKLSLIPREQGQVMREFLLHGVYSNDLFYTSAFSK